MAWNLTKPRIMVAIPTTEKIYLEFAIKTLVPLYKAEDWCVKTFSFCRGVPVSVARDTLVKQALADPYVTHILFVDTDCIPEDPPDPNEALRRLYACDAPIVSGLYRAKQQIGFNYAAWMRVPGNQIAFTPIQSYTGNWFEVDAIGMGFCLIKREVFETIPPPWFPWPTETPSEDFNFCIKAKEYGYKIMVFADVKVSHIGSLKVKTDGSITTLEM